MVDNPARQHGPSFPPWLAWTHTRVSPPTNLPNQSYPQEASHATVSAHELSHQGIHSVDSAPAYPIWGTHTRVLIPGYPHINNHTRVSIILDSIPMFLKIPTYQDIDKVVHYPKQTYPQGYPQSHHRYIPTLLDWLIFSLCLVQCVACLACVDEGSDDGGGGGEQYSDCFSL